MFEAPLALGAEGGAPGGAVPGTLPIKHPNSGLITPLWLGDGCDGLSALYAAVNGIRLALADRHRWTAADVHFLMSAGLRFFDGRLSARQCVLGGIRVRLWHSLAEALVEAARQRTGRFLSVERVFVESSNRVAAFDALERCLATFRVPMILLKGGIYTAVNGITPSSILLFDARGSCWISKRVCGVPGDANGARHVIYPTSFMALNA